MVIKPTGTANDSSYINMVLSVGNGKFVFSHGIYNIEEDILVKSNSVLEFEEGAIFKKNPTSLDKYNVMLLRDVTNVTIINPTIEGDKYTHKGTGGEWGHGINLQGTSNVKIKNGNISKCWGDGIFIGATPQGGTRFSSKTWIDNTICDDNRRNGLTVSSVKGLYVKNSQFNNTTGTDPQAGIDFEPDSNEMFLEDIVFNNILLKNNGKRGVFYCFWLLFGDTDTSAVKTVSITMNNVKSEGGLHGHDALLSNFTGNAGGPYFNRTAIKNISGEIVLNDCESKNTFQNGLRLYRWFDAGLKMVFNNFKITNPNREKGTTGMGHNAIVLFDPNLSTTSPEYRLGGVEFNNLEVTHANDDPLKRSILVNDITNQNKAKNLIIRNTKNINGTVLFAQMLDETCLVIDDNKVHKLVDPVTRTIGYGMDFYTAISNKGATSSVLKVINAVKMHNEQITFLCEENQPYIIRCAEGQKFLPFGTTQYTLTGIGSRLSVKRLNDSLWVVTDLFGNYTSQ